MPRKFPILSAGGKTRLAANAIDYLDRKKVFPEAFFTPKWHILFHP